MRVSEPWFPSISPGRRWARAGGFLFCSIFLCGGALCLYQMTIRPAMSWLRALGWEQGSATVESSDLLRGTGSKGATVYSIGVQYTWNRSGQTFRGSQYGFHDGKTNIAVERMRKEVKRLAPGTRVACWVNPQNPREAVLLRALPSSAVMGMFFSLPFLTVGILGTGWNLFGPALAKRNRRRRVETLRRLKETGQLAWPSLENPETALDSGEIRLIFARSERATVAGAITALSLFWNGIVAVFVLVAVFEATGGSGGEALALALFLLPFIAIGTGMAWLGWAAWRNLLRPNWVAFIHPVPGLERGQSHLSFAAPSPGREISWGFKRLRLVAMAAPWDSRSQQPQRSPRSLLFGSSRRPPLRETGKVPEKEHELTSLEFPLPGQGQAACVAVPSMPGLTLGSKKQWVRWWALEIEHWDGRLESFDLSTE